MWEARLHGCVTKIDDLKVYVKFRNYSGTTSFWRVAGPGRAQNTSLLLAPTTATTPVTANAGSDRRTASRTATR